MSQYRRCQRPDHTYFFTVRTARRGTDLLLREIEVLRHAMRRTQARHPFDIVEIVVLGDVIHCLWRLPPGDADYATRWRMVKTLLSRAVDAPGDVRTAGLRPGEKGLWQRRFWEHMIRDEADLAAHRHLIFCAPVQAGLVNRPEAWPHSSVHRAIRRGEFTPGGAVGLAYAPLRARHLRVTNITAPDVAQGATS
ncbi:MAG: transposase [Pseudomonadota bacterium]